MKKVALISGSSSGIGKSIAHSLIEQNYIVFISGRNADTLANVSAQLGSNCFSYCGDLTHTKHINEFIQKVLYEQGQIDLCMLNLVLLQTLMKIYHLFLNFYHLYLKILGLKNL